MLRRWFLSYHTPDYRLAEQLKAAIERRDPESRVFFAPTHLRAGGLWSQQLAQEIADATAFILLIGERGLGKWQMLEYDEALEKRVQNPEFSVVLVLLEGQSAPGLPFLRRLHWIVTPDPASEKDVGRLFDATSGTFATPTELWRHASPYRGLAAMEEKDSDYFFGRERETVEVLRALAAGTRKIPVLLGNSGVGKSSLAQAGVLAALRRQGWPASAAPTGPWPAEFGNSRRWCFLTLRPGSEPVRSLVEGFLQVWQLDRTSTEWPRRRKEWIDGLLVGSLQLADLVDQTDRRYEELGLPAPPQYLLYIDQGEELYARAGLAQGRRFSELVAGALENSRIHSLMSLRADFFGELQKDEPLYSAHRTISVPPLRETELREVVSQPAVLLGAHFAPPSLADAIARRAAEDSTKDAGALPLLSYLLDDMWKRMIESGHCALRLPIESIDLGRVLVERANSFIASHPNSENTLRRIFTLKLATVREDGELTRRRAWYSEFSAEEWRLVTELADHPYRLLVTVTPVTERSFARKGDDSVGSRFGEEETCAEVAHEAIFRRWNKLREWIAAERSFLAWRSGVEFARRTWQSMPKHSKNDALLAGFTLRQARDWLRKRPLDVSIIDRNFVIRSVRRMHLRRLRACAAVATVALAFTAWWQPKWLKEQIYWSAYVHTLPIEEEKKLTPKSVFQECRHCPKMVVIERGSMTLGSDDYPPERPPHKVMFDHPFAVAEFEATFQDWDKCVAFGDCAGDISDENWGRGQQPVINVSWKQAQVYVGWLRRVTGKDYRLLTEAEWEYAARAGRSTYFSFGNDDAELSQYAWYSDSPDPDRRAQRVGQKKPNAFGLYDMHGNVSEWVEDCYHDNYRDASSEGAAWTLANCGRRVVRGGSWQQRARALRSAARDWSDFAKGNYQVGFRVARTLDY